MLTIDNKGHIVSSKVTVRISLHIERGDMAKVNGVYVINGIVVHQTDASTAQSTFNSYMIANANGAHFLIDKDGTIYQTASIYKRTNHVGKIRARCVLEKRCLPTRNKPSVEHNLEKKKDYPDRFPTNADSIGIELVGRSFADSKDPKNSEKNVYETVTNEQNESLKWLITELSLTLGISLTEVFRHPVISYKNKTEASTAVWQ